MTDLKAFMASQLKKKQQKANKSVIWEKRREKWLEELYALFNFIEDELINVGFQKKDFEHPTHTLAEETLGIYQAPGLLVNLPAGEIVKFVPVASVILGGYGRVDVIGPTNVSIKLIADDADPDDDSDAPSYERKWAWVVVPTSTLGRRPETFRFDKNGLAHLLMIATEVQKSRPRVR